MPRFALSLLALSWVVIAFLGYLLWRNAPGRAAAVAEREAGITPSVLEADAAAPATSMVAALAKKPVSAPRPPSEDDSRTPSAPSAHSAPPLPPRVLALMKQYARWRKLSRKSGLIAEMNLPAGQAETFKNLLVERDYAESDARTAMRDLGVDVGSATGGEAMSNAVKDIDRRIEALLGEAGFQRYTDLVGAELFRDNIAQTTVEGYLVDLSTPLAPAQSESLARAFYQAFVALSRNPDARSERPDPTTQMKPSQAMVVEQVRAHFSPEQLDALQRFFRQDNELGALINAR